MSRPPLLALALVACSSHAQVSTTLDCADKPDATARLACLELLYTGVAACTGVSQDARLTCYDQVARRKLPEDGKVPPRKLLGWKVRDKVAVDTLGNYAAEKGGATLELGRDKGVGSSKTKVAALYLAEPVGQAGWNPFYGIGWQRDSSDPAKRSDARELTAGITGAALSAGGSMGLYPTVLASVRKRLYTQATELVLTAHGDVYVEGLNYSDKSLSFSLVPVVGLAASSLRDKDAKSADGSMLGAYAGARFEYVPKGVFPRLTVSGKLQLYADAKAPAGAAKRQTQYGLLGLGYDLADPESKTGWVPSIKFTLEHGAEPVSGEGADRKVGLSLNIRFN